MKKLIYFLIPLFLFIPKVKADTILTNMTTNYYYSTYSTSAHSTTGFRDYGTNMYGMEEYPPTYDDFEYLNGFDVYIPYSVTSGSVYTVSVYWYGNSLKSSEFLTDVFGERLNTTSNAHGVNGTIGDVNTSYSTSNCFTYSGDKYCQYNFITTYTFNATSSASAFRVGTYYTNGWALYFTRHYLTSQQKVTKVKITVNNDNTIINQNDTIINQNQQIINGNNETNNKIDETNENLEDIEDTLNDDTIDDTNTTGTLEDLADNLPTNSVVSDLLLLPVRLFQSVLSGINGSCSPFSLGSLYGTNLTMPCINIQNYLGSSIWTFIDIVISGMFVLVIRKKFVDIFHNLTDLRNGGNELE